jgi:lipoprotein-releasing system permease protein
VIQAVCQTEGVAHTQRITYKSGVLKTDDDFKGVILKGIGIDYNTTFLQKHLVEGRIPQRNDSVSTQEILLSKTISDKMKLKVGDKVYAYFFDGNLRARRYSIVGIYCTYLNEYDDKVIFTDIKNCNRLNGWQEDQCSALEIQLADPNTMSETSLALSKVFNRMTDRYGAGYTVMSAKELNYEMFAWLDLLDMNVTVILLLMIAVACFMVVSGLFIIILERTQFIGIMKAMGADNQMIRKVFLHLSILIIMRGLLVGNLLGAGIVILQKHMHLIKLDAANYYVEYVPVSFQLGTIVLINILIFAAALFSLLIPSYLVSRIDPVKTIRFE